VKRVLVGAALTLAVGIGAAAASADGFFQTPSRNIGCVYLAKAGYGERPYLRCDIGGGLRPRPPRPKSCDLDWGYGYSMRATGKAAPFCAGDTARNPGAPVVAYGRTWRKGPFTCVSRRIGLRCTNRSKHGFFLSRQHSYTF
jgi:Family of unknown function (DUF6636)